MYLLANKNWKVGVHSFVFFFFQAEDGIRDTSVTGVQTCALPISGRRLGVRELVVGQEADARSARAHALAVLRIRGKIGRASCRERVRRARVHACERRKRMHRTP